MAAAPKPLGRFDDLDGTVQAHVGQRLGIASRWPGYFKGLDSAGLAQADGLLEGVAAESAPVLIQR